MSCLRRKDLYDETPLHDAILHRSLNVMDEEVAWDEKVLS